MDTNIINDGNGRTPNGPESTEQKDLPSRTPMACVIALILGIVGIWFLPIGVFALIFGVIGIEKTRKCGKVISGRGIAVIGTLFGLVETAVFAALWFSIVYSVAG